MLAVGIARVKPHQGRFARIVPGMLALLFYYLALLVNRNALSEDQLPLALGLWLVHAGFLGSALFLLKRVAEPVRM